MLLACLPIAVQSGWTLQVSKKTPSTQVCGNSSGVGIGIAPYRLIESSSLLVDGSLRAVALVLFPGLSTRAGII